MLVVPAAGSMFTPRDFDPESRLEGLFRENADPAITPPFRDALCRYVDARLSAGWLVERIIIDVKRIGRHSFATRPAAMIGVATSCEDAILDHAITLCIKHYYRAEAQ